MHMLGLVATIIGLIGALLKFAGISTTVAALDGLPMAAWVGVMVVGAVAALFFRRPSD